MQKKLAGVSQLLKYILLKIPIEHIVIKGIIIPVFIIII